MSSLPPSPRSRASLARVAFGMQEELKARRIVCPADRGAACVPRLNSPLAARVRPGRSCSVSCGRRGQAAADAQPALDEVAANASSPSARCVRLGHFPLPPRAARRGPHSGRRQRIGREHAMVEASLSRACSMDGRSCWRCAQRACALLEAAVAAPRPSDTGGERRPARKSWTTARACCATTAAVLRPGRLPRSYRCLSNRRLPLSTRRPRRAPAAAAERHSLRGRGPILAVASAAERHNSAGAGRPPRKAFKSPHSLERVNDMSVSMSVSR